MLMQSTTKIVVSEYRYWTDHFVECGAGCDITERTRACFMTYMYTVLAQYSNSASCVDKSCGGVHYGEALCCCWL